MYMGYYMDPLLKLSLVKVIGDKGQRTPPPPNDKEGPWTFWHQTPRPLFRDALFVSHLLNTASEFMAIEK